MGNDLESISQKKIPLVAPIVRICKKDASKQYADPREQRKHSYDPESRRLDVLA